MGDRIRKAKAAVVAAVKKIVEIKGEHNLRQTLNVDVWYPDHPPRTESSTFAATRRKLIESGLGECYICGSKEELEAHHWHVEWAFADAVDWDRLRILHPSYDWSAFKSAEDFVDHEYNMMVLCETHHRHKNHGIHNLPYPIWIMQKHVKAGFQLFGPEDPNQSGV